jgi:hypothetical protein
MATQGGRKKLPAKASVPNSDFYIPPVRLDVVTVRKSIGEEIMGWIAACVLVAFLLPLGAMLYLDILDAKYETKRALEKLEKIEQRIERKQRDKDRKEPNSISDNPIFDRVRRPF